MKKPAAVPTRRRARRLLTRRLEWPSGEATPAHRRLLALPVSPSIGDTKAREIVARRPSLARGSGPDGLLLHELQAWRRETIADLARVMIRDLRQRGPQLPEGLHRALKALEPKAPRLFADLGLSKLLQPIPASATRATDWAHLLAGSSAALFVASQMVGASAASPTELAVFALLGALAADVVVPNVHIVTDEVIAKDHRPGAKATAGVEFKVHHMFPSWVTQTEGLRVISGLITLIGYPSLAMAAAVPWPEAKAFLLAFGFLGSIAQLIHQASHKEDPGAFWGALQDFGLVASGDYHGIHHKGDPRGLLPDEDPLRHLTHMDTMGGYLWPTRHLFDHPSVHDYWRLAYHRLTGKDPIDWVEYPELKAAWTAPRDQRAERLLKGRIDRYREKIAFRQDEEAAAQRTLDAPEALATPDHRQRAHERQGELRDLLGKMRDGLGALQRRYATMVDRRERKAAEEAFSRAILEGNREIREMARARLDAPERLSAP